MNFYYICILMTETLPLISTIFAFIYGIRHFFKKGTPFYLQSLTLAMGCHALGSLYHITVTIATELVLEGFNPSYLGHIGFFLFFITSSYGYMDRIIDDGSKALRKYKYIALLAPLFAILLFIPNLFVQDTMVSTKITYLIVWIPALASLYFNLKHALLPNIDYGFIKSIRPYNILSVCLGFAELLYLSAWNIYDPICMALSAILFSALTIATVFTAERGAKKWTA